MKEKRDQLLQFVSDAEIVSIISHVAPDRDAIGSTLGLFWILKQKFPEKEIVMLNENDNRIKPGFIEGVEDIRVGETKRFLEKSDVVIILDQGSWKRVAPRIPEEILDDKKVIVIDHHLTKTDIRNDIYIHKIVPATGQLIFELFEGDFELVQRIAKPLLMAIFDDTGGFRYPGVDSETLRIAGMLLDTGLKIYEIAEEAKEIEQRIYEAGMKVVENVKFDS
ncbi:MAG TPA: DHH family phosphoesterase, partial [Candidatus Dojkabacteria bacterium]